MRQFLVQERHGEEYYAAPTPAFSGPVNVAYFCPFCGEIWARELREKTDPPSWITFYQSCEKCPPRRPGEIPGSLFNLDDPQSIPDSLLEREFFIHVNYLRRYHGEENYKEVRVIR